MPELPEVETIRRFLRRCLPGRRVSGAEVWRTEVLGYPSGLRGFCRRIKGSVVETVRRRGKYLILVMDRGRELIIHLRLSGHIELRGEGECVPYERFRLTFVDGTCLVLADPRVLARVYLVDRRRYPGVLRSFCELGPEPLSSGFDSSWLEQRFCGRRVPVKSLLLDQSICCGVGNIYSDEALFRAGILPTRLAAALGPLEVSRLVTSIKELLREGIRYGGTTLRDRRYLKPDRSDGGFGSRLAVHGRAEMDCPSCGAGIRSVKIGGRGSYYCPKCQV